MSNTHSVIACIDKRFDSMISSYYDSINLSKDYYMITAAGSSLPLSYSKISKEHKCYSYDNSVKNTLLRDGQLTNFTISQQLSNIVQLDILDHQDCGAFRVFLPCVSTSTKEEELEAHKKSLDYAEKKIKSHNPKFTGKIKKKLIDLNGTVGELQDDGSWIVVFQGQGNVQNGLF